MNHETTARIREVCRYIDAHAGETLRLDDLAAQAAMSRFHFARSFKAVTGVTPGQYLAEGRMRALQRELRAGEGVDAAIYQAGFGSPSRVYERAGARLGMTPAQYRRGGEGVAISFARLETPAGKLLVGATDRGLCFVRFGESFEDLERQLRDEYANASIEPMERPFHPEFERWVDALAAHLNGTLRDLDVPVDVRATAFQLRVWKYLTTIPYGSVESYAEVAAGIGAPTAARAVARACASNPVAIAIPCHRVIRGTGELGGYRWGIERKRALLERERAIRGMADAG